MLTSKQRAYLALSGKPPGHHFNGRQIRLEPGAGKAGGRRPHGPGAHQGPGLGDRAPFSPDAAEELARETGAEVVQVIGTRFVLYRRHPKEPKIVLPKGKD